MVLIIAVPLLVGLVFFGTTGGIIGGAVGVLGVLFLMRLGDEEEQESAGTTSEEGETIQDIVDDINEIGVSGAPAKNEKARSLEREAKEKRREGDEEEADDLLNEAKGLYRELVEKEFEGTFPYKRLAIIHRREENYKQEISISRNALRTAKLTENQREHFEHRIERANELNK